MKTPTRLLHRGFTLTEILIVVLLIAIMAIIVVPNIGTAANTQVVSAACVLQSDLEVARSLALTTQIPYSLVFSPDLRSYKVVANYGGGSYAMTTAVGHPVNMGQKFEVTLSTLNKMSAVTVSNVNFGGLTYVTFQSLGDPVAPGTITLRGGNVVMVVTVESLTGVVSVTRVAG
jgi:prepilin-type N-terminal cleavage/methylation domain-containing protein